MRFGNLDNKFLVQRLNDAANSITSTPFTIENTSTTNSLYINSTGTIINGATALGQLTVYSASASTIGMVIRSAASQTANLTEWQDSTGYLISRVDSSGSHWINAVPATSGSVETSSAYLYLTSNRWTGSASTAEVFGLNNFRFGGTGAAGAFALHLKPASSANAYLSIAGDSSRSVGVNVQYPSASSGYGQFGVQIQDASYKGIVVKAVASQAANVQEWQDSSGAANTFIDQNQHIYTTSGRAIFANTGYIANTSLASIAFSASRTAIIAKAAASQTANIQEWQDNSGVMLANVGPTGGAQFAGLNVQGTGSGIVNIGTAASGYVGLIIKGVASQTANLQEWQDSAGTVVARITNIGGITTNSNITQGTAGRTFIGGATDSGAFLNVNVPTASRQGIAVRANASQTGNLQEWQNSSGAVLSAIDASGLFTSVSQPIQVAGSTYGFTKIVSAQYGATAYWKIATLPATSLSTCDQINIEAMLGGWASTGKAKYEIMLGNRDTFAYKYTKFGDGVTQARIQSYTEADGSVSVYLYSENTFTTLAYNITLSAVTSGSDIGATIYKNPTASTTAPTGTKSFDTADPATYIPLMNMTNAGLLSTKNAAFTSTSTSAVTLTVQSAASQTANIQEWKNNAGTTAYLNTNLQYYNPGRISVLDSSFSAILSIFSGNAAATVSIFRGAASQTADLAQWQNSAGTTYLNITNAGAMLSSGGVTIASNPTINAYGAAMKIASGVNTYPMLIIQGAASQTADLQQWQNNAGTVVAKVDASGNFSAISKSFDIPHPTKENMRLRYASLEGNEHGVYVRGITKEKFIELPEYWTELVDESTITVSLTSVGKFQKVYVEKIEGNKIYIGGRVKEISYAIFGERKDINKLIVEY